MTSKNCEIQNNDNQANKKRPTVEEILNNLKALPKLDPVKDNNDKCFTYQVVMEQHKRALEQRFYYEALFIDYNYIEDRLRSFLFHCGVLTHKDNACVLSEDGKAFLLSIRTRNYKLNGAKINGVSLKINIIYDILDWANNPNTHESDNSFSANLKNKIQTRIDISGMVLCLNTILEWTPIRNKLIHDLMNNNVISIEETIVEIANYGIILGQYLSSQIERLKK